MSATRLRIFISSVQKELGEERRAIKEFIEGDPLLHRFFTMFLFENMPASDRRADSVYLAEVEQCTVYIGLFGYQYGGEDKEGVSPTEREFDHATAHGKVRLVFVKGADVLPMPSTRNSPVSFAKLLLVILMILLRKAFLNAWEKNVVATTFWLGRNETCLRHIRHTALLNADFSLWDIYETYGTINQLTKGSDHKRVI